jgi:hypothetical protein
MTYRGAVVNYNVLSVISGQKLIANEKGDLVEKYHFLNRRIELRITRRELA